VYNFNLQYIKIWVYSFILEKWYIQRIFKRLFWVYLCVMWGL